MKKALLSITLVMTLAFLAACGNEDEKANESTEPVEVEKEEVVEVDVVADEVVLEEPTEEAVCDYCNMVVYGQDDDMGMFTAQGVDEHGHAHFFDDVGCMLNYETLEEVELEKHVRDFDTLDWLSYEEATIVKSDIKTPMNYGYSFFTAKVDAEKFAEAHDAEHAEMAMSSDVATVSMERHKMKMEKMKNGEMDHDHDDEEHEDSEKMHGN